MKKAFTMIELIFVIVILGILASLAIPKLLAARDDAHISVAYTQLHTLIKDFQSYYTANGAYPSAATLNLQDLTGVKLYHNAQCDPSKKNNAAWMRVQNDCECILVKAGTNDKGEAYYGISLWAPHTKKPVCQKFINALLKDDNFGGGYADKDFKTPKNHLDKFDTYYRLGGSAVNW